MLTAARLCTEHIHRFKNCTWSFNNSKLGMYTQLITFHFLPRTRYMDIDKVNTHIFSFYIVDFIVCRNEIKNKVR